MEMTKGYRRYQPVRGWLIELGRAQILLHLETIARGANGSPRETYEYETMTRAQAIERRAEICDRLDWAIVEWCDGLT